MMGSIIPWIVLSIVGVIFFCTWVKDNYGVLAAIVVGYPLVQFIIYSWTTGSVILKQFMAISISCFVALICVAHYVRQMKTQWWVYGYGIIIFIILIMNGGDKAFGNHSMIVCSLAIALPFIMKESKGYWAIVLWSIILCSLVQQTSLGLFGVVISSGLYFFMTKMSAKSFLLVVLTLVAAIGISYYTHPSELFDDSSRFKAWSEFLGSIPNFFDCKETPASFKAEIFGHGIGSFLYLNLKYVNLSLFGGVPFWDAHNDFLQLFFEGGPIYCGVVLIFIISIFKNAYHKYTGEKRMILPGMFQEEEKSFVILNTIVLITFLSLAVFNFVSHYVYSVFPAIIATMNLLDRKKI